MNSNLLWYVILIAFIIRTFRNGFYLIFLWQLKEYRLDRIFAHIKTGQGKKLFFGILTVIKWIPLIIYSGIKILSYLNLLSAYNYFNYLIDAVYYFFWSVWVLEAILNVKELVFRGWKVPKFTLKVILILSLVFILQFGTALINIQAPLILGPILDKFLPISVFLLIILFSIPSFVLKKIIIILAKRKIANNKYLIVIGITGSYGKTSTKEFLATILGENFKVAKTPEFNNTDIGIAKYILKDLKPKHQVFVVEMGAYKKGEIKAICDMVRPKIGIITGINQQHLELFGSIQNTMKAKFELIESLPKDGIAIFNGSNKYCLEMAEWANKREIETLNFNSSSDVKNIKISDDHLEFSFIDNKKSYQFLVNLLGAQSIQNLLPAIYAAKNLGMKMEEIQKGAAKIISQVKTMQFVGVKNGATLIDDTFNANTDGVVAAVDYMKIFKCKKILVLTPLIELGEEAEKIHERLGEKISKICDLVLLTNFNYSKSLIYGAKKVAGKAKIHIVNTLSGVKLIQDNLGKDGVVVFEGKEAGRILKHLTDNS